MLHRAKADSSILDRENHLASDFDGFQVEDEVVKVAVDGGASEL